MNQYVIIGNGAAAAGCIEGIRSVDQTGSITVVSGENHPVYARPLISYFLMGKTDPSRMNYRPKDFYETMNVSVIYGAKAVSVDPKGKEVLLSNGQALSYSSLCIAAGSSPFVPPFEGLESVPQVFSFMTLDDALALNDTLTENDRVLIVGAGLIGLKCAEGILARVKSITVCDLAPRVLSSILDEECAGMMQAHLEQQGMTFMLGDTVTRFSGNTAVMQSGKTVEFDRLIMAVGVRANIGLVKDAGGETDRGILADTRLRTSLPDVYTAGDCAQGEDASIGAKRVLAIMPNAYLQGHAAGVNMAGGDEVFDNAIPMNSIGFFGLHAMTAGSYDGEMYEEREEGRLKRLFVKDDRLIGFILIGAVERAGIYTSLIREKTPLSELDFDLLKKVASTVAFSQENRRKKFGGVV